MSSHMLPPAEAAHRHRAGLSALAGKCSTDPDDQVWSSAQRGGPRRLAPRSEQVSVCTQGLPCCDDSTALLPLTGASCSCKRYQHLGNIVFEAFQASALPDSC